MPLPPPRFRLALVLFLLTCLSTVLAAGPLYAVSVMFILTAHEFGHFVLARRHGIAASFPYFLPMPLSPIGTLGAVILMPAQISNRRALFDMAIAGPLAGLGPAVALSWVGLLFSTPGPAQQANLTTPMISLGEPLLFQLLTWLTHGPLPPEQELYLHPLAFAGWVGIFITALNLTPISQLDGGHILYALLKKRSYPIAIGLLAVGIGAMILGGYWGWSLMLGLLLWIGPKHPPTADDEVPLSRGRHLLGWLTLLLFFVGFTPTPFTIVWPQ